MCTGVVVITGANRGIGLGLCEAYHAAGQEVIGVCRSVSDALVSLGVQCVSGVDVTRDDGWQVLHDAIGTSRHIDVLVLNAGVLIKDDLVELSRQRASLLEQFRVNAMGPLRTVIELQGLLKRGSKVVFVSSKMSSVSLQRPKGLNYGYKMSKAALNMAAMCLASDLEPQGIAVMLLHPGAVATDLFAAFHGCRPGDSTVQPATTSHGGPLTVQQSAASIVQRIDELTLQSTGSFIDAQSGERLLF